MLSLPVSQSGNSSHICSFGGQAFILRYNYNTRNKRLYLTLLRGNEVYISGVRIVADTWPTQNMRHLDNYPAGELLVSSLKVPTVEATIGNVGQNKPWELFYLNEDEVVAE